ncbi:MAG: hypothetical protein QMB63_02130 [Clostridiaceae bacterium]
MVNRVKNNSVWILMAGLGLIYVLYYVFDGYKYVEQNYNMTFRIIYQFIAVPIVYMAISAIVTNLVLDWSNKKPTQKTSRLSLIIGAVMMVMFLIFLIAGFNKNYSFLTLTIGILENPVFFAVVGILIAIGIRGIKKENT